MHRLLVFLSLLILIFNSLAIPILAQQQDPCGLEGQKCCIKDINSILGGSSELTDAFNDKIQKEEKGEWWQNITEALSPLNIIGGVVKLFTDGVGYVGRKIMGEDNTEAFKGAAGDFAEQIPVIKDHNHIEALKDNISDGGKVLSIIGGEVCNADSNGPPLYPSDLSQLGTDKCICQRSIEDSLPPHTRMCFKYFSTPDKRNEYAQCTKCGLDRGIYTGLGCIYTSDWQNFIAKNIFGTLLSLAALVSFFCILWSAFIVMTSQGNAEQLKQGKELIMSCLTGMLLIIFSVFIMRLIGVEILQLPWLQ